jgi:hypothetical protein
MRRTKENGQFSNIDSDQFDVTRDEVVLVHECYKHSVPIVAEVPSGAQY